MIKVRNITKQGAGKWLIDYTIPYCCGFHRATIVIEQTDKPTIEEAEDEVRNRNKES